MAEQLETTTPHVAQLEARIKLLESDNELLRASMRQHAGESIKLMSLYLALLAWINSGMPCMDESDELDRLIAALDRLER